MSRTVRPLVAVVLLFLLSIPALAVAAQFEFTKSQGVRPVAILTAEQFQASFGDNPAMPRTDEAVVAYAKKIFRPYWVREDEAAPELAGDGGCGEDRVGILFAALANPAVSDAARAEVDALYAEAIPPLPKTYISGKFKILYTDNNANPDHNVTLTQVQTLASRLNSYYSLYVGGGFAEPKHYHYSGTLPRIDVKVYYIGGGTLGQTGSGWNHIELCAKNVVRDVNCKGKTTTAHELFHRVQYSYGYVSGTANLKWMVEGTASWSQRHTNWAVGDYMSRMNQGLTAPDINLITTRAYDACHLWVFLQQRAAATPYHYPIRRVWQLFSAYAVKNSAAAKGAFDAYTRGRFGAAWNFDYFNGWWNQANLYKDYNNADMRWYEYAEDERRTTCGSVTYGPLVHVPRITGTITSNTSPTVTKTGSVKPNGADYYVYTISPGVTHVRVVADGQAGKNFIYYFGLAKSNNWNSYAPRVLENYTFTKTFTSGAYDQLTVVVVGKSDAAFGASGSYTLRIGP